VALALLLLALTGALQVLNRSTPTTPDVGGAATVGLLVLILACCATGVMIVARQPSNAVGWVFAALGMCGLLSGASEQYSLYTLLTEPGALPGGSVAAWLASWIEGVVLVGLLIPLFLLFPDGKLPSARWRPTLWLWAVSNALILAWRLAPGLISNYTYSKDITVTNPFGIPGAGAVLNIVGSLGWALALVSFILAAFSLVMRLRHSHGLERQQLKWITFAGTIIGATALAAPLFWNDVLPGNAWPVIFLLAFSSVPISAGIAILKHNLYDIDLLINRALVYAVLTASLGLAYVVSVLALQWLSNPLTPNSSITVAASTLVVGALFRPARGRIQAVVDRRFYRRKYDAERTIAAFSVRLRAEVDLDALCADLQGTVSDTMQPASVSLWLRPS